MGSRGSPLALTQSQTIKRLLETNGNNSVEINVIKTVGDQKLNSLFHEIPGKGVFTRELDQAILNNRVDLAVHSLKDLPTELPKGLRLSATPKRVDPRDVLVCSNNRETSLASLPSGSRIGTSSIRRAATLAALHPHLNPSPIRGNVDSRIRRLDQGEYDGLILAGAGLIRLGLTDRVSEWLEWDSWLNSPGQGALGIVIRADDDETDNFLKVMHCENSHSAVTAERAFLGGLGGGCEVPIAASCVNHGRQLRLKGLVVSADGSRMVRGDMTGSSAEAATLGEELAKELLKKGADLLLEELSRDIVFPGM
jgi:hydroxymethylbilane synthase